MLRGRVRRGERYGLLKTRERRTSGKASVLSGSVTSNQKVFELRQSLCSRLKHMILSCFLIISISKVTQLICQSERCQGLGYIHRGRDRQPQRRRERSQSEPAPQRQRTSLKILSLLTVVNNIIFLLK